MSLEFAGADLINFKETGPDYRWVDIKRFKFHPAASDDTLLAALIGHPWYSDDYSSDRRRQQPKQQEIHGPYKLDCISPGTFVKVTAEEYVDRLTTWFLQNGSLPGSFLDRLTSEVLHPAENASSIYELPNLGPDAVRELGWIVGTQGFSEFVLIDRVGKVVSLIVGSDD